MGRPRRQQRHFQILSFLFAVLMLLYGFSCFGNFQKIDLGEFLDLTASSKLGKKNAPHKLGVRARKKRRKKIHGQELIVNQKKKKKKKTPPESKNYKKKKKKKKKKKS